MRWFNEVGMADLARSFVAGEEAACPLEIILNSADAETEAMLPARATSCGEKFVLLIDGSNR